jgi:hypothetical protein
LARTARNEPPCGVVKSSPIEESVSGCDSGDNEDRGGDEAMAEVGPRLLVWGHSEARGVAEEWAMLSDMAGSLLLWLRFSSWGIGKKKEELELRLTMS